MESIILQLLTVEVVLATSFDSGKRTGTLESPGNNVEASSCSSLGVVAGHDGVVVRA